MANRVTNEDILIFNEIYYKTKNYAQVARETGFSASTVRKYIDKNWQPIAMENVVHFNLEQLPDFKEAVEVFRDIENYGFLCQLTPLEKEEIEKLWTEMVI